MQKNADNIIETRRKTAKLIIDVVLNKITVLNALKNFPKDSNDPSVLTCFHILVHYEADEELRKKDSLYKETQDEFMVETAETLIKGDPLPVNVISEYKNYYGEDLFYKVKDKNDILKRLKKIINL